MDQLYAEIHFTYASSGPENHQELHGNVVATDIYVWDRQKLVPSDCKMSAESTKSNVNEDNIGPGPTVCAAAIPGKVHAPIQNFLPHLASVTRVKTFLNWCKSPTRRPPKDVWVCWFAELLNYEKGLC